MEQIVELTHEEDGSVEQQSSKKDLKCIDAIRDFIKKGKSNSSNNILSFLVQVEDLVQRKQTLTIKNVRRCSIYRYPLLCSVNAQTTYIAYLIFGLCSCLEMWYVKNCFIFV